MLDVFRAVFGVVLLAVNTLAPRHVDARPPQESQPLTQSQERPLIRQQIPEGSRNRALAFARTELYFGTAMPDGVVTEAQFQEFLDYQVSPRFPEGLTILKAEGRFRDEEGDLVKERSFVLVLLYPYSSFADASRRIERIRMLYKSQFKQQSVLRVDNPFVVWVSF
jgi:Protein of unknown function (DUF3574)